jgi:F-type H+-transporting ATPase subunit b
MEVIQTNALISINATFVVQLVSFLIFMVIMNRLMFQPLRTIMAQRKFRIHKLNEEIGSAGEELAALEADLDERKRVVRQEAREVNLALEEDAGKQIDALINETRAKTAAMRQSAEKRIQAQLDAAREQVAGETRQLADQIMQKILQRRLS